ncbi:MAG: hypothetical protein OK456_03585 [Thaumarchaeota archaeon]|nr:hypothetical protein [Nitrososphaerota archaeon]
MSEKAAKKKAPAKKSSAKTAKPKKTKAKAEKQPSTEEPKVSQKPVLGPSPRPMVEARHRRSMRERAAKGYSSGELESVGLGFLEARKHHVPIDIRRRTTLDENVQKLKGWYKVPESKAAKPAATEKAAAKTPAKRSKKSA